MRALRSQVNEKKHQEKTITGIFYFHENVHIIIFYTFCHLSLIIFYLS